MIINISLINCTLMIMSKNADNSKRKLIRYGKDISKKHPRLRPVLVRIKKTFAPVIPRFSGWGMQTEHELPWVDEYDGSIFRKASIDIKKQFQFKKDVGIIFDSKQLDELQWRHWNVSYAVRHAIKFAKTEEYNFVECGVAEAMSTFFAMREITGISEIAGKFSMHLYDAWAAMKKENLLESEKIDEGRYQKLDINITKKNLEEFNEYIIYHQGYIPESFYSTSEAPHSIVYLHIDLNSAKPTLSSLEFFYSRLVNGGIILFDDYGWLGYEDTKKIIDKFFSDKPGIILKLPTGQAFYFKFR